MNFDNTLKKDLITQDDFEKLFIAKKSQHIDFVLIDVREEDEFCCAKIDGVDFNMPLSKIATFLPQLKMIQKQIVIYCRTDRRSKMVFDYLSDNGIKSCYLLGGITQYKGKII